MKNRTESLIFSFSVIQCLSQIESSFIIIESSFIFSEIPLSDHESLIYVFCAASPLGLWAHRESLQEAASVLMLRQDIILLIGAKSARSLLPQDAVASALCTGRTFTGCRLTAIYRPFSMIYRSFLRYLPVIQYDLPVINHHLPVIACFHSFLPESLICLFGWHRRFSCSLAAGDPEASSGRPISAGSSLAR
ncbi:hypothetical protein M3N64_12405 [Sporolactobacillus sp. CPB3-1]|uniref:Secreted protein n=1 Tax=Sporolactobacillus mangiferae TaxID=2940498 RepID=A0ABT0MCW8_9BACL|nr:hypothetical protein [Sporolactobacillus mangiferae]MCL1632721.1 hypothetical protein [Sporolactobacillus mangiferae]